MPPEQNFQSPSFNSDYDAYLAILSKPRPYTGYGAGFPIWDDFLPVKRPSRKLNFGSVPVSWPSDPFTIDVEDLIMTSRLLGIAAVGDFSETDSCSAASPTDCQATVIFRPQHPGISNGVLLVVTAEPQTCTNTAYECFVPLATEIPLTGFGIASDTAVFVGSIVTTESTTDTLGISGPAPSHCFAQALDPVAPTLTGVFIGINGGPPPSVVLHHSAVAGAHFDIFCSFAPPG